MKRDDDRHCASLAASSCGDRVGSSGTILVAPAHRWRCDPPVQPRPCKAPSRLCVRRFRHTRHLAFCFFCFRWMSCRASRDSYLLRSLWIACRIEHSSAVHFRPLVNHDLAAVDHHHGIAEIPEAVKRAWPGQDMPVAIDVTRDKGHPGRGDAGAPDGRGHRPINYYRDMASVDNNSALPDDT